LLNKLKHAELDEQGLATVFQAIDVPRVLYALPAWFGQLTQLDIGRINGLFRKAHRWQLAGRVYTVEQLAVVGRCSSSILRTYCRLRRIMVSALTLMQMICRHTPAALQLTSRRQPLA